MASQPWPRGHSRGAAAGRLLRIARDEVCRRSLPARGACQWRVSTDCNPGTSPVTSLVLMLNMACTAFEADAGGGAARRHDHAARALGLPIAASLRPAYGRTRAFGMSRARRARLSHRRQRKPRRGARRSCHVLGRIVSPHAHTATVLAAPERTQFTLGAALRANGRRPDGPVAAHAGRRPPHRERPACGHMVPESVSTAD